MPTPASALSRRPPTGPAVPRRNRTLLRLAAALLAVAIFLVDTPAPLEGAVAVLYVAVVLIASRTCRRSDILIAGGLAICLTLAAYTSSHGLQHVGSPTLRGLVSLAAIGITALLALQNQASTEKVTATARLIDLSHDMIFVRDPAGVVTFWNCPPPRR